MSAITVHLDGHRQYDYNGIGANGLDEYADVFGPNVVWSARPSDQQAYDLCPIATMPDPAPPAAVTPEPATWIGVAAAIAWFLAMRVARRAAR